MDNHGVIIFARTPNHIRNIILDIYQKPELYCLRFHPCDYRNISVGTYIELGSYKIAYAFINSEAMNPYRNFVDYF